MLKQAQSCLITHWAEQCPDQLALICPQQNYTWRQVEHRVSLFTQKLIRYDVNSDDVIVVIGKNSPELVWLYLAAMCLSLPVAILSPAPSSIILSKLNTLLSGRLWLFAEEQFSDLHSTDVDIRYRPLSELSNESNVGSESSLSVQCRFNYCSANLASLIFTSGSTGQPKAVAHSHEQHIASAQGLLEKFHYRQDDTWLLSLPLYHVSGLSIIYRWLVAGGRLKIGEGELAQDIQGVTHASLVPVQLQRLLEHRLTASLSHVLLGGSYIPAQLCEQAENSGIETWLGYGMTEAASTVTAKRFDGQAGTGFLLPKRQVKIEQQRIYIAGETLTLGYYYQGKITPINDDDGWFDSKDLGYWHNNQLQVLGRADNMFISGGENIHCEEIEAALMSLPSIKFAMVLPVKDERYGERPIAVISVLENMPSKDEIEADLANRLEKFKWPIDYLSLPHHFLESGIKVSRSQVKQWLIQVART